MKPNSYLPEPVIARIAEIAVERGESFDEVLITAVCHSLGNSEFLFGVKINFQGMCSELASVESEALPC